MRSLCAILVNTTVTAGLVVHQRGKTGMAAEMVRCPHVQCFAPPSGDDVLGVCFGALQRLVEGQISLDDGSPTLPAFGIRSIEILRRGPTLHSTVPTDLLYRSPKHDLSSANNARSSKPIPVNHCDRLKDGERTRGRGGAAGQ